MNENKSSTPRSAGMPGAHRAMLANSGKKAKNFKATIIGLIKYLQPFWALILVVFAFAVAGTIFSILSPRILGNITNEVVKGISSPQGINFGKIGETAILLISLYLLSSLFNYIQGWIMSGISQKISYQFRKDISEKINQLPLKYFDRETHGEILSRVTNDVDTVSQTLNQSLTQIVTSITLLLGILAMMISISGAMTLVALFVMPLSFGFVRTIVKNSQKLFKSQQDALGKINGHIEEMFSGHCVMKVFNGEKQSIAIFKEINNELYQNAWKAQFLSGLLMPIMNFIGNLGYVGVAVLGGWLTLQGKIKIGDIQAFIQYLRQFNQPITQTANIANILQSTAAAAERVFKFLTEEEETAEVTKAVKIPSIKGHVQFENVVFGYNSKNKVIKNFNADIRPGQRVAIVGPTGAGKTTIVNLLMRFYDVNKGAIKIDKVDIRQMKRSDLRKMFGMVLQDTWLFNGTIKKNISYGNLSATDEEICKVAKVCHIDHVIRSLPKGYNMEISEEADNISQGEKQLLTIARAMLANPPFLILDEATSSVDTRTEILIQKAMDTLMKGRTCFIIAHRLSTIKNADLILVMNKGSIVEQGTHKELLAKKGFYANLYNSQFASEEEQV